MEIEKRFEIAGTRGGCRHRLLRIYKIEINELIKSQAARTRIRKIERLHKYSTFFPIITLLTSFFFSSPAACIRVVPLLLLLFKGKSQKFIVYTHVQYKFVYIHTKAM